MSAADPKDFLWAKIEALMGGGQKSIDQVMDRTKASRGTIQRIREGKTSVGTDKLLLIANAFGLELSDLLTPVDPGHFDRPPPTSTQTNQPGPPSAQAFGVHEAMDTVDAAVQTLDAELLAEARGLFQLYLGSPTKYKHLVADIKRVLSGESSSAHLGRA